MAKTDDSQLPKRIQTLIGAGMRIDGDVTCDGVLRVQGAIAGNVQCPAADGALVVDGAGSVTGTVGARYVAVSGSIVGPVQSSRRCEVQTGGSIAGDIEFAELAIHSGGMVDGKLTHVVSVAEAQQTAEHPAGGERTPARAAEEGSPLLGTMGRRVAFAAVVLVGLGLGGWSQRELIGSALSRFTADKEAPAASLTASTEMATPSERAPEPPGSAAPATAASQPAVPAAVEPLQSPLSQSRGDDADEVVSITGTNPSRPANVFLLVSNEASVLYRKKRGDQGEGARIAVPRGGKVSVSIGADEIIRVAKGSGIEIYYQGRKVPAEVIEKGTWMGFVPR